MTDRVNGFVVTLERDMRSDDAEAIVNAIRMLKGVIKVEPVVEDVQHLLAVNQATYALRNKIWEILK